MQKRKFLFLVIIFLIISTLLDEVIYISLLYYVISESESAISISLLLLSQLLPGIVTAPLGGYFSDRFGARRMFLYSSIPQCLILIFLSQSSSIYQIYLYSAFLSITFSFSGTAVFALIPPLSERCGFSVEKSNAVLEISRGTGSIAGPALGGVLIGSISLNFTVGTVAVWSLIAPLIIYIMRVDSPMGTTNPTGKMFLTIKKSYKPILAKKDFLLLFITFAAIVFSTTFSDVVFIFFATDFLLADPWFVGALISAWASGLVIGATWLSKTRDKQKTFLFSYVGAFFMGQCLLLCGLSATFFDADIARVITALLFVFGGIGNGIHNVAVRNAIHMGFPSGQHGKAFAVYTVLTRTFTIAGFFSGGLFGAENSLNAYILAGIMTSTVAFIGYISQQRIKGG